MTRCATAGAPEGSALRAAAANRGRVGADLRIDVRWGMVAAHAGGVAFQRGLGRGRLARKSLLLSWSFRVAGLGQRSLQGQAARLTRRVLDSHDHSDHLWPRIGLVARCMPLPLAIQGRPSAPAPQRRKLAAGAGAAAAQRARSIQSKFQTVTTGIPRSPGLTLAATTRRRAEGRRDSRR
ncbi:MAG: hypothetical protein ACK5N0_04440 [Synechococcaceae cyanobacterium]